MQLYYYPGNANLAPHMVLRELDIPFELALVDRDQNLHKSADYLRLNPNGRIPVLVDTSDGELVLYESAAICMHLADRFPAKNLLPAFGTAERAHAYKWLMWLSNTLQSELLFYFYPERLSDTDAGRIEVSAHAEARVADLLALLDTEFARHGGPWLLGEQYSIADPFLLMLTRWTRAMQRPARSFEHLAAFQRRMFERPAVVATFNAEALPQPWV